MTQYFVKKVLCLQQKAEKKSSARQSRSSNNAETFVIKKIKNKLKLLSSPCQFLYFCRICSLTCLVAKFTLCICSILVSIDVFRI